MASRTSGPMATIALVIYFFMSNHVFVQDLPAITLQREGTGPMSPHGNHRHIHPINTLLVSAALAFLAVSASAQEVAYTTVTRSEFGGAMGQMMKMVPGGDEPTRETTFVKGSLMRTDSDESSTIMNPIDGILSVLQHDERTYYSFSMDEMGEMAAGMAGGMMAPEGGQGWEGQPQFETRISTDRTGRTQEIGGFEAQEVLMTVEMVTQGGGEEEGSTMVLFTQLWLSSDVPGYDAYQAAQAQMAEGFMNSGGGGGLAAAFAQDPGMQDAFKENMKVLKDIEGMPVKTVSAFVTVPNGMEFDVDAALASMDEPLSSGEGGMDMAAAAQDAMRNLGGMFGRRGQKEEEEESGPEVQTVTMRVTSTIEDIRTSGIGDELFQIPEGYRKVDPGIGGIG